MFRSLFVILIMVIGIGASFRSRQATLLLYVWFALFRPQEWLWVDISSLRLSLVIGLLLLIPSLLTGVLPNLTHPLSIGMFAFFLTGLVSQTQAVRPDIGWVWIDYLFRLVTVCLLAVTIVNSRRRLFALMAVTAASIGFQSAKAGLASLIGGGVRFSDGQAGAFIDNNGYALAIAMIIPFLIATAQNWPADWKFGRFFKPVLWVSVPLSAYALVSTFSRGGLLAFLTVSAVLILVHPRRFRIALAVVVLAAAIGPFIPIPEGYFDRMQTIQTFQEVDEDSAVSRLHFWRVAIDMVERNPLGVGLKNFEQRYDEYDFLDGRYGRHRAVHSSHFQVLAEQGYLGAALWTGLFLYATYVCLRIRRQALRSERTWESAFDVNCANALLASLTAFVVGGAFLALSLNDLTWLTFAMVASLDRAHRLSHAAVQVREIGSSEATRVYLPA